MQRSLFFQSASLNSGRGFLFCITARTIVTIIKTAIFFNLFRVFREELSGKLIRSGTKTEFICLTDPVSSVTVRAMIKFLIMRTRVRPYSRVTRCLVLKAWPVSLSGLTTTTMRRQTNTKYSRQLPQLHLPISCRCC